ncbi:hypothetical protein EYF80_031014 [Liparis tanakae]|uniref:Uncharacterized protein n=1 Tax=Liparis tanakae TaxID=230148 RepID=A0A4Z2GZ62_9TELE|nr:hypothetical protein EYF80_031014 [Liparis tanakae]
MSAWHIVRIYTLYGGWEEEEEGRHNTALKDAELRFGTGWRNQIQIQSAPVLGGDVTSRM